MNPSYTYAPLSGPSLIRILVLEPAATTGAELRGEIIEVDIEGPKSSSYEAISYTWDSQSPSEQCYLTCDGMRLLLTPNAETVLRHLRKQNERRRLWIDSVCIDQCSVLERNHQVSVMKEIYTFAHRVLVWLGQATEEMGQAFRYISCISERDRHIPEDREFLEQIKEEMIIASSQPRDPNIPYYWSILGDVFRCSWFSRVWTVQEVATADPEMTVVMSGTHSITFGSILRAMETMQGLNFEHHVVMLDAVGLHRTVHIYLVSKRRSGGYDLLKSIVNVKKRDKPIPLISPVFTVARQKQCTNPRDYVFALYGICKELGVNLPTPNYEKDLRQVFYEATKAIIEHDQELDVLYMVSTPRRLQDLPSWVPDWSDSWNTYGVYPNLLPAIYDATATKAIFTFSTDCSKLIVVAKIIDTVSVVAERVAIYEETPRPYGWDIYDPDQLNYLERNDQLWRTLTEWARYIEEKGPLNPYQGGATNYQAFYYTILQDIPNRSRRYSTQVEDGPWPHLLRGNPSGARAYAKWYNALVHGEDELEEGFLDLGEIEAKGQINPEVLTGLNMADTIGMGEDLDSDEEVRKFHHNVWEFQRGKRFFTTEKGYMGTAEGEVHEGDVVALISGMEMPMILTPCGDCFRVAAHAYMHGVMDGEAWPDSVNELQLITLA